MKTFFTCLGVIAALAAPQFASAGVVTSVLTSNGAGGTNSTGDTNITGNAFLTSFSTATTTYSGFTGATSISTSPAIIYGTDLAQPTAEVAVGDLNLGTGTLNGQAVYGLPSISAGDTIFVFGNGNNGGVTPPGGANGVEEILFFTSDGATQVGTISNDVFFQDSPTNTVRPPNVLTFDLERTDRTTQLINRSVSGFVIDPANISFGAGFSIADIGGINLNDNSIDIQDVGIAAFAVAAVPEPTSLALVGFPVIGMLLRRKRS